MAGWHPVWLLKVYCLAACVYLGINRRERKTVWEGAKVILEHCNWFVNSRVLQNSRSVQIWGRKPRSISQWLNTCHSSGSLKPPWDVCEISEFSLWTKDSLYLSLNGTQNNISVSPKVTKWGLMERIKMKVFISNYSKMETYMRPLRF